MKQGGVQEKSIMMKVAWVVAAVGVLFCLWNVSEFNDRNLSLMIGMGCIIASVQIAVIGLAVELFHGKNPKTFP